jgi:TonB family protein
MKKTTILFIALFTSLNTVVFSQTTQKPDSVQTFEKARYLKESLTRYLYKIVRYPEAALTKNIQGDVVLSLIITRNGRLDSLAIIKSKDFSLSTSAIVAINSLEEQWSPTSINGSPVDRKYLIIFRYRIYLDIQPADYKTKAVEYFEEQKYEKALKLFNKSIKDNQYDFELFEFRSRIKEILGDSEGSKQDFITSANLKNEVMSVVNVYARGVTNKRTVVTGSRIEIVPVHY